MAVNTTDHWDLYERNFSKFRMQGYLQRCGGDRTKAIQLYDWNVLVSQEFWGLIAYIEVAFRNSLANRLIDRSIQKGYQSHWVFDEKGELGRGLAPGSKNRGPYLKIVDAERQVKSNNKAAIPEQIVSEIAFGFWIQLVSQKQIKFWPDLAGAFPNAESRSQIQIQPMLAKLRDFRNRIGHHHRIWNLDLETQMAEILRIAKCIDLDLEHHLESINQLNSILLARPI